MNPSIRSSNDQDKYKTDNVNRIQRMIDGLVAFGFLVKSILGLYMKLRNIFIQNNAH